ncbi:MAG: AraC family transcriptional regulator, partial [Bacteroidaceae bacterium]|nr:AraC family transcriptional regulator [Bacteroidaceae bacterium]
YAKRLHITPKYFSTVCKQVSGCTAGEIVNEHVLRKAKMLLRQPSLSIKQIASRMGFRNASHFGTWVRRNTGMSPQALRNAM